MAGPGFQPLLAAGLDHLPLNGVTSSNNASGAVVGDMLTVILVGTGLAVLLALIVWFKYTRKRSRGGGGSRRSARRAAAVPVVAEDEGEDDDADGTVNGSQPHQHRRKRRPRRNHRPRNPTLAETGGLPPERTGPPHLPLG